MHNVNCVSAHNTILGGGRSFSYLAVYIQHMCIEYKIYRAHSYSFLNTSWTISLIRAVSLVLVSILTEDAANARSTVNVVLNCWPLSALFLFFNDTNDYWLPSAKERVDRSISATRLLKIRFSCHVFGAHRQNSVEVGKSYLFVCTSWIKIVKTPGFCELLWLFSFLKWSWIDK